MSASQQLPLTVTYTPTSGLTSTVTVLGQVLNNGATNWVPTNGHAIYLATTPESGASQTVLQGQTYYLTTGPAVPDQATGVPVSSAPMKKSSSVPASTTPSNSQSAASSMPAASKSLSGMSSSPASASPSSTSSSSSPRAVPGLSMNKMGYVVAFMCCVGFVLGLN